VPTIADTRFQMVQLVFPEHTNLRGTLYGGRMMSWIATAGTLAASRFARGLVVLGAMDDLDFLTPVHLGEIVTVDARVECVGRTSLEVGVEVYSESPRYGVRRRTTFSHLAFIALDEHERPRPVGRTITPGSAEEEAVYAAAAARKAARAARVRAGERGAIPASSTRHSVSISRFVMPEDALSGTLMFAGKLLGTLDEAAAITAVRYSRGPAVTASLDAVYFSHPLRVGQIADIRTALMYVGRSSMEIGVQVEAEEPRTGRRHHTCTAFLTMVHLSEDGRPAPVPPLSPATPAERRQWDEAQARWTQRKARVARLREAAGLNA
jgi:acyl-coenzyme A thioesterase 7